ncbi:hypothetical protein M3J09_005304 [Ascochyta lentis]
MDEYLTDESSPSDSTPRYEQLQTPTAAHLEAVSKLTPNECITLINDFLEQNRSRFDVFRTSTKNFSPAWDSRIELDFLTDAVLWLDALLLPFREDIFAEDTNFLKPHLEQAAHEWHAIRDPLSEEPVSGVEKFRITQISNRIAEIQASNQSRTELLESTNIDVAIIQDLLLSAETVKYRRAVDHENDDLSDGLRRIYRTVVCAIPVGLSEYVHVVQPKQKAKIKYKGGPFHPYVLPDPPEILDHSSIHTRITSKGYTGVPLSEQRAPLSDAYFREMHQEMFEVTAAQREDSAGTAKLKKNATCMDRDWGAFYDPLYTEGMCRYEEAARRRIEREERPATQPSPTPSDYTDTSFELTLPFQDDSKPPEAKKKLCRDVNRPGGCPRGDACPDSHSNRGVHCKKNPCSFEAAGGCAFLHNRTRQSSTVHHDLRLVLDQVLASPRMYKPCTYINKPEGCKREDVCWFNHTLRGVVCPDFERCQSCPRGDRDCPLVHKFTLHIDMNS